MALKLVTHWSQIRNLRQFPSKTYSNVNEPVVVGGRFLPEVEGDEVVRLVVREADERHDVPVDDGKPEAAGLEGSLPAETRQVLVQLDGGVPRWVGFLSL